MAGFHGKVLVVRGAREVTSVRSCQKVPSCPTEPIPAGCKTDPLLAKAETISDGGSPSGIMYSRRGKSCFAMATRETSDGM